MKFAHIAFSKWRAHLSLWTLIGTSLTSPLAIADILIEERIRGVYEAHLYGSIVPADVSELRRTINSFKPAKPKQAPIFLFTVDSRGGDVQTAIQIGRVLRKLQSSVQVERNADCASACVFVLAGAVVRTVSGRVSIHRPYVPTDTDTSADSQRNTYKKLETEIKNYLTEMNVSTRLYDDMLFISPENSRLLSEQELSNYGIGGWDPYYEQAYVAKEAKELGISTRELLERRSLANRKCGDILDNMSPEMKIRILECHRGVLAGRR
jgi:ATP-dependent protease ClpP protease subunit